MDNSFIEFSFDSFCEVLRSMFSPVFEFLISFFLDWFTSLKGVSSIGDSVLTIFYNLFSSVDISNFLSIFVGFVFTIFVAKFTVYIIRG